MIALLLRLYPARWRARYGDEFEAVLAERPLGPFDVADILLGAIDAHLHLRGLGAASDHGKGFTMSLRIGGYAAIFGGVLWFVTLFGAAAVQDAFSVLAWLLVVATAAIVVALAGMSAFQARTQPVLTWAAFLVPAVGAVMAVIGLVGMGVVGDGFLIGGISPWDVWAIGLLALLVGSALFALVTWRANTLSRPGAALLGLGALGVPVMLAGMTGGSLPEPVGIAVSAAIMLAFSGGWVVLGISAIRLDRPAVASSGSAA